LPTYKLYDRERVRERFKARLPHAGNFVTVTRGGYLLAYDFGVTEAHYKIFEKYPTPYSHPIGYVFPPPDVPAPVVIGTVVREEETVVTPTIIVPPPIVPPEARTRTVFTADMTGVLTPGTTPTQIMTTEYPIAQVLILADSSNTANIWISYRTPAAPGACFPLAPGSAKLFTIDDLSDLYLVAENSSDKVYYVVDKI
jgi:hypothetical protein